jgi:hypothetical protein
MGGGGSKPKEIEQENRRVNGVRTNTRGIINVGSERFMNKEEMENLDYELESFFNLYDAIYIILISSGILIFILMFMICNHKDTKIKKI